MKNIVRFTLTLAYHNEKYPSEDPKTNKFWADVREYYLMEYGYLYKYDECEICGEETLLSEIGLNWHCDNPDCEKEVKSWYDDEMYGLLDISQN